MKMIAAVLSALCLATPAAFAAPENSVTFEGTSSPRIVFSLSSHYLFVDGWAYAREHATEQNYTSAKMLPLDVSENLGIKNMWVFAFEADGRLTRRNHLVFKYYYGSHDNGQGDIDYPTGFNDSDFPGPDRTDGAVTLEAMQFMWYYRTVDTPAWRLDLGLGVESLRSYASFATESNETDFDTEATYAPFVTFGNLRAEWVALPALRLGTELQMSFWSWQSQDLTDLPAKGYFYKADLFAVVPVGKYFEFETGANFWNYEVDFDGVEINHLNHLADNEVELFMMGAYAELTLKLGS